MPRPHHYSFAHKALPQMACEDPAPLFQALACPTASTALQTLWDRIGEELAPDERLPPSGLRRTVHTMHLGRKAVVVELPQPAEAREAYFVALVQVAPDKLRCFTLDAADKGETRFGEWANTLHMSYGAGPLPLVKNFLEIVEARL